MGPKTTIAAVLWGGKLPVAVSAIIEVSGLEEEDGVFFRIAETSKAIRCTSSGGKVAAVEATQVVGEEEETASETLGSIIVNTSVFSSTLSSVTKQMYLCVRILLI